MSYESLSHSKWGCKYHVVFVLKHRKKVLYGKIRKFLGPIFHELAGQRRSKVLEGHYGSRPCPYGDFNSAEIRGIGGYRIDQEVFR